MRKNENNDSKQLTQEEEYKKLLKENERLKIENEYLKRIHALMQVKKAKKEKKQ